MNGDIRTFRSQAKYYWLIDARQFNREDDDDMDQDKFNQMFREALATHQRELMDNDCGEWSREAREWAVREGLFAGNGTTADGQPNYMWGSPLTREQAAQLFYRFAQKYGPCLMRSGKRLAPQKGGFLALLERLGFTNCLAVLLVLLLLVGAGRRLRPGRPEYQVSVHRRPGLLDGGIHSHWYRCLHFPCPHSG